MKIFKIFWACGVAGMLLTAPVHAQGLLQKPQPSQPLLQSTAADTSRPREGLVRAGEVQAAIVAEMTGVVPGRPALVGLRIIHDPHWHTYWRNPGDSGLATQIEWRLPPGVRAGPIQWPTPKRLPVGPLANFGFEGDLLLPVELTLPAGLSGNEVVLTARASWLVCKDVCIPGEAMLAIRLPVVRDPSALMPSADAPLFAQARPRIPQKDSLRLVKAFVAEKTITIAWSRSANSNADQGLSTAGASSQAPAQEDAGFFYPYLEGLIAPAAAQRFSKTADGWRVDISLGESPSSALQELKKTQAIEGIWVVPGRAGVEWRAAIAKDAPPQATTIISAGTPAAQEAALGSKTEGGWSGLWAAMAGALLGGMILNLMPCVFPVIGLKVLSFAQAAHSRFGATRQAVFFSLGVVLSFVALAGLLLGLRAAGEAIGWGFQLQSPWVVLLLALLFVMIAVNLFGVFEIGLLGVQAANLGFANRAASGSGGLGAFSSGVLAVAVASPCTAPFMGSAIGFTATAGVIPTLLVFAALGAGMALPYLVLASWPGLLSRLPRPGPWMARFKQAMAFPMLAAAAWLLWVLANLQGSDVVFPALGAAIALSLALWIYGSIQSGKAGAVSLVSLVLTLVVLVFAVLQSTRAVQADGAVKPVSVEGVAGSSAIPSQPHALAWQPWAPGLPERLQSEGHTVFVDFTATWCISCQANKLRVLQSDAVIQAFAQGGVKTLRADWTRKDAQIAAELARHGRNGVPLYLVYSKSGAGPRVLSEWLTEKEVLEAIRQ